MHPEELALRPEPWWGDLSFLSVDPVLNSTAPNFESSNQAQLHALNDVASMPPRIDPNAMIRGAAGMPGIDPFRREPKRFGPFEPHQLNAYSYAYNNPVSVVDPTGEAGRYIGITGRFGAGGGAAKTRAIGIDSSGSIDIITVSSAGGHGGITAGISITYGTLAPDAVNADLAGPGGEVGGSVGEGVTVGGDVAMTGGSVVATEVNIGIGGGTPVELHGGATQTTVENVTTVQSTVMNAVRTVIEWIF